MTVGKRIKQAREKANMTQKELAQKAEKGFSTIQKYELDLVTPPLGTLEKIATVLNAPFSSLIPEDMMKDNTEPDRVKLRHAFGAHHGDRENIACKQLLRLNEEDQNAICHLIDRLYALEMENDPNDYGIGDDDASK